MRRDVVCGAYGWLVSVGLFVVAVVLVCGVSVCGMEEENEIVIPIEIWDVDGKRMSDDETRQQQRQQRQRPRFVITALQGGSNGNNSIANIQPSTFDLGNPNEMILVAEYCQSCPSSASMRGCPLPVPMHCRPSSSALRSSSSSSSSLAQTCAPSWPDGFVPANDLVFHEEEEAAAVTIGWEEESSSFSLDRAWMAGSVEYPPNSKQRRPVRMQCFSNATHSRYTISATLNTLAFYHPSLLTDQSPASSTSTFTSSPPVVYHSMTDVQMGAMIRTVPEIDRVWSNIGIGYQSQFLSQIHSRAILIQRQQIVFHAQTQRYAHWSSTPFQIMHHRRVHTHLHIHMHSRPTTTNNPQPHINYPSSNNHDNNNHDNDQQSQYEHAFHIDTGNDGIALRSTHIQTYLAKSTGGLWISKPDFVQLFPTFPLFHHDHPSIQFLLVPTAFAKQATSSDDANSKPDILVDLAPHIQVRIPTNQWILMPPEDQPPQLFVPTIFSTYDKNVLGLPFILATQGMAYDDENLLIYIQNNHHTPK